MSSWRIMSNFFSLNNLFKQYRKKTTYCSETTVIGESWVPHKYTPGDWTRVSHDGKHRVDPWGQWDCVWMQWDCRLSTGLPPQEPTMSVVKPEGGPAASMKPGQKSCVRSSGIITLLARVTIRDEARLIGGNNEQSRWGHQCSETTLLEESWFYISTSLGIEPGSFMTGSKGLTHWIVRLCVNAVRLQALPPHYSIYSTYMYKTPRDGSTEVRRRPQRDKIVIVAASSDHALGRKGGRGKEVGQPGKGEHLQGRWRGMEKGSLR